MSAPARPRSSANIVVNQSGVDAGMLSYQQRREARERIRRELGLKDFDVLFMFAGVVRSEKGVVQLAQAFLKLAAEHSNAFLVIAGGTKLWGDGLPPKTPRNSRFEQFWPTRLRSGAYHCSASSRRQHCHPIMPRPMCSCCLRYCQEAFGLVILEAFAAGIPVIGARSGGVPELVEDGRTGLLVDQGDVDGLHRAMRRLLLDHELRGRLGTAARQTAVNMSWENTVDRLERIYQDVLASKVNPDLPSVSAGSARPINSDA